MADDFRLYKRMYTDQDGKESFVWWYVHYVNGVRIRKPAGRKCTVKREAQEFIEKLRGERTVKLRELADARAVAALPEQVRAALGVTAPLSQIPRSAIAASANLMTLAEYCARLFVPNAAHLRRQEATDGTKIAEDTRLGHRGRLDNYILPRWGCFPMSYFERPDFVLEFHDWLVDLKKYDPSEKGIDRGNASGSLRNNITETMAITLRTARHDRIIQAVQVLERFVRKSRRQDTLSLEELDRLFPTTRDALADVWTLPDHRDNRLVGLMLGAAFCLSVSTGLRSGEFRAMSREHIIRMKSPDGMPVYVILVTEAVHRGGEIGMLKKATEADTRARVVQVSGKTMDILDMWLAESGITSGPIFLFRGEYMSKEFVNRRWQSGLRRAGIDTETRRLTMHSARYTYTSQMRRLLSPEILQAFTGHRSDGMTDLYDNPHMEDVVRQISESSSAAAVEKFWG